MEETDATKNNANKNDDDLITLRGLGKITQWKFPKNVTQCPMHCCNFKFKMRATGISHFKQLHAEHTILCTICRKIVSSRQRQQICRHFDKMHPNEDMYSITGIHRHKRFQNKTRHYQICNVCHKKYDTVYELKCHFKEVHIGIKVLCPLITCNYSAKRVYLIRNHWRKAHPNFHFPELRESFKYRRTNTKDTQQNYVSSISRNISYQHIL